MLIRLDRRSRPMGLALDAHRRARVIGWGQLVMALLSVALPLVLATLLSNPLPAEAAPGLCTGPVCADAITRSAKNHWQLVLRLEDQQGHREKVVVDCRAGVLSPQAGLVDRGYAKALGLRLCRYVS